MGLTRSQKLSRPPSPNPPDALRLDAALEPEPVRARLAPNSPEPVRTSFFGPIVLARLKELPLPGSPGIIASPIRRGRDGEVCAISTVWTVGYLLKGP